MEKFKDTLSFIITVLVLAVLGGLSITILGVVFMMLSVIISPL